MLTGSFADLADMLFRKVTLDKIKEGSVTMAIRRMKRPTVKTGGTIKTRIGVLNVHSVEEIEMSDITPEDLAAAGYDSMETLEHLLARREGHLYRIKISYKGIDPRIALRNQTDLSDGEFSTLVKKLDGFDKRSNHGPWAYRILNLIDQNPGEVSIVLAEQLRVERLWLKGNIRKLKSLGLTISLGVGYKLSPRGQAFLTRKNNDQSRSNSGTNSKE